MTRMSIQPQLTVVPETLPAEASSGPLPLAIAGQKFSITPTGLVIRDELSFAEWTSLGEKLGDVERCLGFLIGDWINYANAKWGDKYNEAIAATGLEYSLLRKYAYVARRVPPANRLDILTFSHHETVAKVKDLDRQRESPKLDAFRALVQQVESLFAELSSLDTATRHRDAIKERISNCGDEAKARKLLGELTEAEQDVTVKQIRQPRLQADLAELLTTTERACNAAHSEATRGLGEIRHEAAAAFAELLNLAQCESDRHRVQRPNEDTIQALKAPTLAERQQRTLQPVHCSVGMTSVPAADRVGALRSALKVLDRGQTAKLDIAAEAARLTAACTAFRKAYTKG
jgi:ElaB/YqjD/DUF883 family membrane-anchored ribosome-binding protein